MLSPWTPVQAIKSVCDQEVFHTGESSQIYPQEMGACLALTYVQEVVRKQLVRDSPRVGPGGTLAHFLE